MSVAEGEGGRDGDVGPGGVHAVKLEVGCGILVKVITFQFKTCHILVEKYG